MIFPSKALLTLKVLIEVLAAFSVAKCDPTVDEEAHVLFLSFVVEEAAPHSTNAKRSS